MSNDSAPSSSSIEPLDYAHPVPAKKLVGPLAPLGVLCLLPGIPITGMAVAVLFVDVMTQFLEWNAIGFFVVGVGLCWLGMWLLRYRGQPAS